MNRGLCLPLASRPTCRACLGIVTYRAEQDLEALLDSVMPYAQAQGMPVCVLNNDPENPEALQAVAKKYPSVYYFQGERNSGYAGGYSFLWKQVQEKWDSPFFVLVTQDLLVKPEGLEAVISAMEADETLAQAGGYILQEDDAQAKVDSLGIFVNEAIEFYDEAQGEPFSPKLLEEVLQRGGSFWGLTGAMFVIRSEVVQRVLRGRLFWEDYFMYKEDIDLAWRLREEAQSIRLIPVWMATHRRSLRQSTEKSIWARWKHQKKKNPLMSYYSYRNHLWLLRDRVWGLVPSVDFVKVLQVQLQKALYYFVFEPRAFFKAWWAVLMHREPSLPPRSLATLDPKIRLSALILHHGEEAKVLQSVAHLQKAEGFDQDHALELIVVNNAPGERALARPEALPDWILWRSFHIPNRGYAQGTNFGLAQSHGPRLLILTDVFVGEKTLAQLLDFMDEAEAKGESLVLAPRLEYEDGRIQDNFRTFPNLFDLIVKRSFLKRFFRSRMRRYLLWDLDPYQRHEVDWLTGAFQMFSRELWEKIGEKDEDFFLFMSDIVLCEKARAHGAKVIFVGDAVAKHGQTRLSEGSFWHIFSKPSARIHVRDALLYFLKKLR